MTGRRQPASCRAPSVLVFLLALAPLSALAHHGQDFLLVESPSVPHPGTAYFIADGRFALDGAEEQAGLEPSLLVGATSRVAFELHAHVEKRAGESWNYEATAPAVHVLLTDPGRHHGLQAGLDAEYEIAADSGAPDNAEVRLSLGNGGEGDKWAANLILDHEQGGDVELGAAFGMRHQVDPLFALGVEAEGNFAHAEGNGLLAAGYWEREGAWTLKFGIGGVRDEGGGIAPVAHVGLVLKIR